MILTELFDKVDDADFFTDSAGILSNPFNFLLHLLRIDTARSFAISVASLTSLPGQTCAQRHRSVYTASLPVCKESAFLTPFFFWLM